MDELYDIASKLLDEKYNPPVHSVASALRSANGQIITAVNIDHFSGFVCAETAALTIAINQGSYDFTDIAAVTKDTNGETVVANMCGKCRQIFNDYSSGINVLTTDGTMTIEQLLPSSFNRQQDKITAALSKETQ